MRSAIRRRGIEIFLLVPRIASLGFSHSACWQPPAFL
jgi:hypothetical protein